MALVIELLSNKHYVDGFFCDDIDLDKFLKKQALAHSEKDLSKTYVLFNTQDPDKEVLAFLTVCASSITKVMADSELKNRKAGHLPFPLLPVYHIAKLATHREHQRQGHAKLLMTNAFEMAAGISAHLGIMGVHLIATNPHAIRFYLSLNFKRLAPNDYFMHINDIRDYLN